MNTISSHIPKERGSTDVDRLKRFSELKSGDRGIVVNLEGNCHDIARLSEIGFRRGAEFTLVRAGATAIVRIHYQSLCLRLNSDLQVQIRPLTCPELD